MFDLGCQCGRPFAGHQYFWSGIQNYVEVRICGRGDLFLLRGGQLEKAGSLMLSQAREARINFGANYQNERARASETSQRNPELL